MCDLTVFIGIPSADAMAVLPQPSVRMASMASLVCCLMAISFLPTGLSVVFFFSSEVTFCYAPPIGKCGKGVRLGHSPRPPQGRSNLYNISLEDRHGVKRGSLRISQGGIPTQAPRHGHFKRFSGVFRRTVTVLPNYSCTFSTFTASGRMSLPSSSSCAAMPTIPFMAYSSRSTLTDSGTFSAIQ